MSETTENSDTPTVSNSDRLCAPWADYQGSPIHEGDEIKHPSGECGTVIHLGDDLPDSDAWRVDYHDSDMGRLCLQVGEKGRAVVCT